MQRAFRMSFAADVSKKAQRAAVLKMLRTEMSVEERREQSVALCTAVANRIRSLGRACGGGGSCANSFPSTAEVPLATHPSTPVAVSTTIHICSFLPMYFEPDLVGVFEALWDDNATSKEASEGNDAVGYRMYVPRMMPPPITTGSAPTTNIISDDAGSSNIMHFVEVLDAADLKASFVPQGKYNITELRPEVWEEECVAAASCEKAVGCDRAVLGHTAPSATPFTQCFAPAKEFLLNADQNTERHHHHVMVVLCPATAYDSKCGRIGKGAGYYDRFLEGAMKAFAALRGATEAAGTAKTPNSSTYAILTIGVGFKEQLVEAVPMEANDIYMDEVILPDERFVRD